MNLLHIIINYNVLVRAVASELLWGVVGDVLLLLFVLVLLCFFPIVCSNCSSGGVFLTGINGENKYKYLHNMHNINKINLTSN